MIPEKHGKKDWEKVSTEDFVNGEIEIKYDPEHTFKWEGKETKGIGVRLNFKLDGCKYPHGTPWMRFNYNEKSTLYKRFLVKLVDNAYPDMPFDLDLLKGMKVQTLWADNGDYQNIDTIRPLKGKIKWTEPQPKHEEDAPEGEDDESIPF